MVFWIKHYGFVIVIFQRLDIFVSNIFTFHLLLNNIIWKVNQDIFDLLTIKPNLEHWMNWTSNLVDNYLNKFTPVTLSFTNMSISQSNHTLKSSPNDANHYLSQAKQFLLKWTYYASLIMKDLARQNARSFSKLKFD